MNSSSGTGKSGRHGPPPEDPTAIISSAQTERVSRSIASQGLDSESENSLREEPFNEGESGEEETVEDPEDVTEVDDPWLRVRHASE